MKLSHIDEEGNSRMVDVSGKVVTKRKGVASGRILVSEELMQIILDKKLPKGDVFSTSRIAGIMAVKKTSDLIPMCHPLLVSGCTIEFNVNELESFIEVICSVEVDGQTGVEMEALTGVSVALLTFYDMCKAVDKSMVIEGVCLLRKEGGKSGIYERRDG